MNIVKVLNNIVCKLDCGICWNFVPGGRSDYLNLAQPCEGDECCAILGLLRNQFTTGYVSSGDFTTKRYRDWNIELFAGVPSRIDVQFYNEVRPDEFEKSKWEKYLHPIYCCLSDMDIDICNEHTCDGCETSVEVTQWNMEQRLNYLDNNYDGWFVRAVIREWLV